MALKPDRIEKWVDVSNFMNEVAEAGAVVVFDSSGVGASLDDVNAKVRLPDAANGSGETPAGILVGDVVNKDLSQTHLNYGKRESVIGQKVGIITEGEVVTNMIADGVTPTAGNVAYFTTDGLLTLTATNSTKVGRFLSAKDADGYAKLRVQID